MGWAGEIATGKPESGSIVCSISIFSDIAAKTILNSSISLLRVFFDDFAVLFAAFPAPDQYCQAYLKIHLQG